MNSINPLKVIFPFYHSVSDNELRHLKHLYNVKSQKAFRKDIDFFLKYYKPLEVDDIVNAIENDKPIKNGFLLTFDDGFREIYDIVVPILKEKGVPAVFFLNTAFIDNKELFFRCKASLLIDSVQSMTFNEIQQKKICATVGKDVFSKELLIKHIKSVGYNSKSILDDLAKIFDYNFEAYLANERPYLTEEQIRSIIHDGFLVGSHSVDHPRFDQLELVDQMKQVNNSLNYLNEKFQLKYKLFSFPFTDEGISTSFFRTIYNDQNRITDLSFGTAGIKSDTITRNIQRIPMEKFPYSAWVKLLFQYFYWAIKIPFGKNEIKRH